MKNYPDFYSRNIIPASVKKLVSVSLLHTTVCTIFPTLAIYYQNYGDEVRVSYTTTSPTLAMNYQNYGDVISTCIEVTLSECNLCFHCVSTIR